MATDGSVSPQQYKFPGAFVSFFGPGIEKINKTYVKQYKKTYGAASATDPFGAPSFVAAEMLGTAISQQCAASHGTKISRGLVGEEAEEGQAVDDDPRLQHGLQQSRRTPSTARSRA